MPDWFGAGEGAITGAEAGSFAGPVGTVIGGTAGAIAGFFSPSADEQSKSRFDAAMKELTDRYNAEQLNLSTIIGKETARQQSRSRQSASRRALSMGRTGSDAEAMIAPGVEKAGEAGANSLEQGIFGLTNQYNQQANQLASTYAQRPLNPTALDLFMKSAGPVSKGIQSGNLMGLMNKDVSLNSNADKAFSSGAPPMASYQNPAPLDTSWGVPDFSGTGG